MVGDLQVLSFGEDALFNKAIEEVLERVAEESGLVPSPAIWAVDGALVPHQDVPRGH